MFENWQHSSGIILVDEFDEDEEGAAGGSEDKDDQAGEEAAAAEGAEEDKATHRYFPPVVGKLKYLKEVQNRVSNNIKLFSELKHP